MERSVTTYIIDDKEMENYESYVNSHYVERFAESSRKSEKIMDELMGSLKAKGYKTIEEVNLDFSKRVHHVDNLQHLVPHKERFKAEPIEKHGYSVTVFTLGYEYMKGMKKEAEETNDDASVLQDLRKVKEVTDKTPYLLINLTVNDKNEERLRRMMDDVFRSIDFYIGKREAVIISHGEEVTMFKSGKDFMEKLNKNGIKIDIDNKNKKDNRGKEL